MDENGIIALLTEAAGRLPSEYTPIGDDVASVRMVPGRLVLKSDMLVGRTDVPPGMTRRQTGRKALAMCVSDFASKGVAPKSLMLSLGIPRSMRHGEIRSLVRGFVDGMDEWGVRLMGGDTNESDDLIIDCVMTGFADRFVERRGARPGDAVVVTGDFGTTAAGLKILLAGAEATTAFRRVALRSVYLPAPRLALGIALRDSFTSAMDSSDGLAVCLHTLATASGVGVRLDSLPSVEGLDEFAACNGYKVDDLVLFGGEEYEVVGTVPKAKLGAARRIARSFKTDLRVIGEVDGSGKVETKDGKAILKKGWVHLS